MIKILTYHEIDIQQWNELVQSSPTATWFQTPEAYQFYASNPEEMIPFAYGIEDDEVKGERLEVKGTGNSRADKQTSRLKAVCIGYVTKEKSVLKQFFTRRAIIIGGPLLADDATETDIEQLLRMMVSELKSQAIYIETRNFHDYSKWKSVFQANGFTYQPHLNIQVACTAAHTMSEQRIRQVKKALKNGVKICQAESEDDVKAWYRILQLLYHKKVRTPLWSEDFFLQFYRNGVGKYLLVKHEGKIIGGMMCPILEGKTIYEWYVCGLDEDFRECYPSVVATYAVIEYAKEHGLPLFDFMGAGKPDVPYGVRDFKMEFGGELVEHGRYICVQKPLLYKIGQWGVKSIKKKCLISLINSIL